MVPFRLTQNVIDAFGVSGVEGAFRRAAELTMQVCVWLSVIIAQALLQCSNASHTPPPPKSIIAVIIVVVILAAD
jgi:uncharacterized membrane-anchored protein